MCPCTSHFPALQFHRIIGRGCVTEGFCTQQNRLLKMSFFLVRPPRSQGKRHPPSACAVRFPAAHSTTADAPKKALLFPSALLLCNPLHLASKMVGQPFLLHSLKRCAVVNLCASIQHPHCSFAPYGKAQNQYAPCLMDFTSSCALAFFAVLSLTPTAFSRSCTSL